MFPLHKKVLLQLYSGKADGNTKLFVIIKKVCLDLDF